MKKEILLYRIWILSVLLAMLGFSKLSAQDPYVDSTGMFEPALTGVHIVYAEVRYIDIDGSGTFNTGFALGGKDFATWGDYSACIAFYHNNPGDLNASGIMMRDGTQGFFATEPRMYFNPGDVIKLWFDINVPAQTYRAYAQTVDMDEPQIIYDKVCGFRNLDIPNGIDRWIAFDSYTDDYLVVDSITLTTDNDPTLKSLTTSIGNLDPAFDPLELDYALDVPFGTTNIQLTAIPNGMGATVTMFDGLGNEVSDGNVSFTGDGVDVEIIVTAQDGTQLSYYVSIYVSQGDSDARLREIQVSESALDPLFSPDVYDYTVIVPIGTATIDVTGQPYYAGASVTGGGTLTLSGGTASTSFEVTSADASATNTYNVTINEADGNNYALHLTGGDGNSSNVDISGFELMSFPYTIEMWFRPEGTQSNNAGLIYHRPNNVGIQYVSSWQTPTDRIRFMTGVPDEYGTTTTNVATDTWHHIAVVLTDSFRTVYFDGEMTQTKVGSPELDYSIGKLYLGWDSDGNNRAFKGDIDEVRIWSDSLTPEQLNDNRLAVLTGNEPNLIGYWNFDLNSPTVAIDLSNTGKHGPMVGGTYVASFSRLNLDLKSLSVDNADMRPSFSAKRTQYYVTLPKGTTSITINAEADDATTTVSGTGTVDITESFGTVTVTVTSASGEESNVYTITYVVESDLILKNSYTFADGTAKDVVGGADGEIQGGEVQDGVFISSEEGNYIVLPGEEIGINKFPSITLEAYVNTSSDMYTDANDVYSMLAYLGGLQSNNALWIQLSRPDDVSRFNFGSNGTEINVLGPEPGVGENHHYVMVVTSDSLYAYIDGSELPTSAVAMTENNVIASLDPANAWICYGGWGDPTWLGSFYEFNIYSGTMDAQTVATRSINFPVEDGSEDATLSVLKVNGDTIDNFASYRLAYEVILPKGTVDVPVVEAVTKNAGASAVVTDATELPGTATVVVTAADGVTTNTYTVEFKMEASTDATLSDLTVDGTTVDEFDPGTYSYDVELPYGTTVVPTVAATPTDANAEVVITDAAGLPGTTTVEVTAEDGVTVKTYSVNFSVAVGVRSMTGNSNIKVYPTLSREGHFMVQTEGGMSAISLFNIAGVLVSKTTSSDQLTEITTPRPGMYILRVEVERSVETFRIIHSN